MDRQQVKGMTGKMGISIGGTVRCIAPDGTVKWEDKIVSVREPVGQALETFTIDTESIKRVR